MAPITVPVFIAGMITCFSLEKFRLFGFGTHLPLRIKELFFMTSMILSSAKELRL